MRWLLKLRPKGLEMENHAGRVPLHIAAMCNNVEMCKVGVKQGLVFFFGVDFFMYVCRFCWIMAPLSTPSCAIHAAT